MATITKDTKEGQEFSGRLKVLSEERAWAFSGGPFKATGWPAKNIHTDLEFAKKDNCLVRPISGTESMGYIAELLIDLFGEGWLRGGKLNVRFFTQVDVTSRLRARAMVRSKQAEDSRTRFNLDVWIEDHNGIKVVAGTAVGFI